MTKVIKLENIVEYIKNDCIGTVDIDIGINGDTYKLYNNGSECHLDYKAGNFVRILRDLLVSRMSSETLLPIWNSWDDPNYFRPVPIENLEALSEVIDQIIGLVCEINTYKLKNKIMPDADTIYVILDMLGQSNMTQYYEMQYFGEEYVKYKYNLDDIQIGIIKIPTYSNKVEYAILHSIPIPIPTNIHQYKYVVDKCYLQHLSIEDQSKCKVHYIHKVCVNFTTYRDLGLPLPTREQLEEVKDLISDNDYRLNLARLDMLDLGGAHNIVKCINSSNLSGSELELVVDAVIRKSMDDAEAEGYDRGYSDAY